MPRRPDTVTVYSFSCFDIAVGDTILPPFKATEDAIKRHFNGKLIPLTGEAVDAAELDSMGRWLRIASGWGSLDAR